MQDAPSAPSPAPAQGGSLCSGSCSQHARPGCQETPGADAAAPGSFHIPLPRREQPPGLWLETCVQEQGREEVGGKIPAWGWGMCRLYLDDLPSVHVHQLLEVPGEEAGLGAPLQQPQQVDWGRRKGRVSTASLAARPERYQPPRLPRPTLAAQGWRGPIPGDAVTLAAVPTLGEAQGERPSCLSSHCSIVQPQRQALLSSLHPRGRETETQSSRTRHRRCIFPTSP